ncbi:MAG: hypothetical protein WC162_01220 [Sphaerochaetaceae bacterium]|nr:hypothetical protein [Sphaerochaetaceae bacterium]
MEKNLIKRVFNLLFLIIIIGMLLFFKVWLSGKNFELEDCIANQRKEMVLVCNEMQKVRSEIALSSTPEYLVWLSQYLEVPFTRISSKDVILIR